LADLEFFLGDRNALLANFGRLGREMAEQIESTVHQTEQTFFIPHSLAVDPPYEMLMDSDVIVESSREKPSLLSRIQADLTLLRNPLQAERASLPLNDLSVQVHVCQTKRREIENVYNVIMRLLDNHRHDEAPLTPADILIMAPNLMEYEPFVKSTFGGKEIDFQLMEVELLLHSHYVRAFASLLDLAFSRWDAASLIDFLEQPPVKHKLNFSSDDLRKFREWIQEAGIRWGEDASHRDEILQRSHCHYSLVEGQQPGTWSTGFDRLLAGLALTTVGNECPEEYAPLELIENSNGELLGLFMNVLKSLRRDLQPLQDGTLLSMEQWALYLKALMDSYLSVEVCSQEERDKKEELMLELDKMGKASVLSKGHALSFSSVKFYLDKVLQANKVNYRESHLQAVRFCSMLPMRALPAKIVVLIGMNEGAFPRHELDTSLDMLKGRSDADYIPSKNDFDRSLFLEALLSARRYFILSYTNEMADNEETPSVLITELLAYLDSAYLIHGIKASECLVHRHTFHAYDAANFQQEALFPSYSTRALKAANAYYQQEKLPSHAFIPNFNREQKAVVAKGSATEVYRLTVRDLERVAKNSLQAYFNKTLGMYINDKAHRQMETDESFVFDQLDLYDIRKRGLSSHPEKILQEVTKEGKLPAGVFGEVAIKKVQEEIDLLFENLAKVGVSKEQIGDIHLAGHCEAAVSEGLGWVCPPLQIEDGQGRLFIIEGILPNVAPQGILLLKAKSFEAIMQAWPLFLLLHAAVQQYGLPIKPQVIFLKDGGIPSLESVDCQAALQAFLSYYLAALADASPLLPEWTSVILQGDEEKLKNILKSHLERGDSYFFNEYAKWSFEGLPDAGSMIGSWQAVAAAVYGPLKAAVDKTPKDALR
jgi:exodeoxyribonuclease V gamma subunit